MFRFLKKIKRKIIKIYSKPKFDKELGLFSFNRKNKIFYSNTTDLFDYCYKSIFVDEIYNFEHDCDNPFIIDCGSNIGLGIMYWKEKFPNARILGFEPDPDVFYALITNTRNFKSVSLFKLALSNQTGEVEFTTNGKLSGSLNLTKNLPKSIRVQTVLLSEYIKNLNVDLLKIDIEGEELKVMKEIEPYLKNVQNIFVEYHAFINEEHNLSELLKILENAGFRYYLDSELKNAMPFINSNNSLNQDLQVNIWAKRK